MKTTVKVEKRTFTTETVFYAGVEYVVRNEVVETDERKMTEKELKSGIDASTMKIRIK